MNKRLEPAIKWALRRKIEREKARQPVPKWIYLIKCHDFYKIGIADKVNVRLATLQTGCPYPLELVASWKSDDAEREERAIHALLAKYSVRGEWFNLPAELVAHVISGGQV